MHPSWSFSREIMLLFTSRMYLTCVRCLQWPWGSSTISPIPSSFTLSPSSRLIASFSHLLKNSHAPCGKYETSISNLKLIRLLVLQYLQPTERHVDIPRQMYLPLKPWSSFPFTPWASSNPSLPLGVAIGSAPFYHNSERSHQKYTLSYPIYHTPTH